MVKLKIARVAAATAASAGLIAGFSGVVSAHPYNSHHDDHGSNSVTLTDTKTVSKNNVGVNTNVDQDANSGQALSLNLGSNHRHNSSSSMGGSATTGAAGNVSSVSVGGTVTNSAKAPTTTSSMGTSQGSNHGNNLTVTNTKTVSVNNVKVHTNVDQDANSGDATVLGGNGGKATTGNASNSSTVNVGLTVQN